MFCRHSSGGVGGVGGVGAGGAEHSESKNWKSITDWIGTGDGSNVISFKKDILFLRQGTAIKIAKGDTALVLSMFPAGLGFYECILGGMSGSDSSSLISVRLSSNLFDWVYYLRRFCPEQSVDGWVEPVGRSSTWSVG